MDKLKKENSTYAINPVGELITLRDYFAGQALVGILSGKYGEVEDSLSDESYKDAVTRLSYEFANDMLKSREV